MTETDLIEINGLVARVKRIEHLRLTIGFAQQGRLREELVALKWQLYQKNVRLETRGWDSELRDGA